MANIEVLTCQRKGEQIWTERWRKYENMKRITNEGHHKDAIAIQAVLGQGGRTKTSRNKFMSKGLITS